MLNKIFLLSIILLAVSKPTYAQEKLSPIYLGVYNSGDVNFISIGSNFEKKYYGELRLTSGNRSNFDFTAEGIFNRNLVQKENINFHIGAMIGFSEHDNRAVGHFGLPLGLTIKPFPSDRNFAFLIEAMPNTYDYRVNVRGSLGLRYRLGFK